MPLKTRLYIGVAVALGCVLLAGCLIWYRQFPEMARFLAYTALACIASTMKVRLPRLHGTISVNFVFILLAVAQLSLAETVVLSFAATVMQCKWRPKTRPTLIQVLFNASTIAISAALAHWTAHAIPGGPWSLIALIPAATVFFVVDSGIVSGVLALISNKTVLAVWRQCHLWAFPFYLVGAVIAGGICVANEVSGWRLPLLSLPLMYLIYSHYQIYVSSQPLVEGGHAGEPQYD
jgi:hypothetical protein